MSEIYSELLYLLQKGLPFVDHPFAEIGTKVGLQENEVISFVKDQFEEGKARRLGAVFDSRRLGYKSTLCGVHLPEERIDGVAKVLREDSGVTHGYLRGWADELSGELHGAPGDLAYPNYWFTYMAPADSFENELDRLRDVLSPQTLVVLPALKRFKIDVIFDTRKVKTAENSQRRHGFLSGETVSQSFSDQEKEIVRLLQGNIELNEAPFRSVADCVGMNCNNLLSLLNRWKEERVIRRFPLILHHYNVGFRANGMCLWHVPEEFIADAGMKLASCPEVTHCYQRPGFEGFPYNLYAMIHGDCWEETYKLFESIQKRVGLTGGKMLCSMKEFKKTSPVFFDESTAILNR